MEAYIINPAWAFLFLIGFAFSAFAQLGDICVDRFTRRMNFEIREIEITNLAGEIVFTFIILVLPVILSACAFQAIFVTQAWSWWLLPFLPVTLFLWFVCLLLEDWYSKQPKDD